MIQLGQKGKDIITGFNGLCMGKAQYLTGCNQVLLTPQTLATDGKRREGEWFDEQRVRAVDEAVLQLDNEETPGADEPAAPTK